MPASGYSTMPRTLDCCGRGGFAGMYPLALVGWMQSQGPWETIEACSFSCAQWLSKPFLEDHELCQ